MKSLPEIKAMNAAHSPKRKTVRVQLDVQASGMVEVELHPETAKEMDRLVAAGKFREAWEMLEGNTYREVMCELDGEVEDIRFVKAKRKAAVR